MYLKLSTEKRLKYDTVGNAFFLHHLFCSGPFKWSIRLLHNYRWPSTLVKENYMHVFSMIPLIENLKHIMINNNSCFTFMCLWNMSETSTCGRRIPPVREDVLLPALAP